MNTAGHSPPFSIWLQVCSLILFAFYPHASALGEDTGILDDISEPVQKVLPQNDAPESPDRLGSEPGKASAPPPEQAPIVSPGTAQPGEGQGAFDRFISRQLAVFDRPKDALADSLQGFAEMIDTYFVDGRIENETNRSRVKLYYSTTFAERDKVYYDSGYSIRIHLPRVEDKLSFEIRSDGEPELDLDSEVSVVANAGVTEPIEALKEKDEVQAGIRYVHKKKRWMNVSSRAGVKFGGGDIDPFVELRGRRSGFFEHWGIHFTETLFNRRSLGSGALSSLNFERPLAPDYLFRFSNQALWWNRGDYFDLGQQVSVYHKISDSRAISYSLGGAGISDEASTRINYYYLSVRYRKMIHGNWIFGEIVPQILYPTDNDFEPSHSLTLRLEMVLN